MGLRQKAQKVKNLILTALGSKNAECTVCGWQGHAFYQRPRKSGLPMLICPKCGSKERHRHQALAFKHWDIKKKLIGANVLHVAPETRFLSMFQAAGMYVRTDINPGNPDQPIDVCCDMSKSCFKNGSFDFAYVSHVLEHIPAVDEALSEIFRVLKKPGLAFFDVPTYGQTTRRLDVRDHDGHIWHPGRADWFQRYEKAGFSIAYFPAKNLDPKFGIGNRSPVTLCTKMA